MSVAEAETLGTTTEDVTADILAHWNLGSLLSEAIRFSTDLGGSPQSVKAYALANYVVFQTLPITSAVPDEKRVEEMVNFLKEMNMNPEHYRAAVEKIS